MKGPSGPEAQRPSSGGEDLTPGAASRRTGRDLPGSPDHAVWTSCTHERTSHSAPGCSVDEPPLPCALVLLLIGLWNVRCLPLCAGVDVHGGVPLKWSGLPPRRLREGL